MKNLNSILALLYLTINTGCMVLPIPHTRTVVPEISGQLIFEDVGLKNSNNEYTYHYSTVSCTNTSGVLTTDESGFFKIEEERKWHYIMLLSFLGHKAWACSFEVYSGDNLIFVDSVFKYPGDSFHKAPINCGKIVVTEPLDRDVQIKKAAEKSFDESLKLFEEKTEPPPPQRRNVLLRSLRTFAA